MHRLHPTPRVLRLFVRFLLSLAIALPCCLGAAANAAPQKARGARDLDPAKFGAKQLLVVHYRRPDGDYDGWNIWAWPEGKDGAGHAFESQDDYGRVAIVPLKDETARVGIIVRRGNWEAKDFDGDRFVELGGRPVTEVWILSGDPDIHRAAGEVDLSLKIFGAFLDAREVVHLATSQPLDAKARKSLKIELADAPGAKPSRPLRVRDADAVRLPGAERAMTAVRLSRALDDSEIARLTLSGDGIAPTTVYARGVLEEPAFTPLDARLGAFASPAATEFTTWSPVAAAAELLLYAKPADAEPARVVPLSRGEKGLWSARVEGDLHGAAYQYRFTSYGRARTVPDIHAFAATQDSARSVVVDLARAEPEGWGATEPPRIARMTDEVIYEIHVRDFSIADASCPPETRGSYLGLVHEGKQGAGATTGLAHLKELGVTAVHLLPVHDFTARPDEYNWGYWTALFNVPEGNFARDRGEDPLSAVRELRGAIAGMHAAGIRVILDVVYNHTSSSGEYSPFDQTVPFHYFRTTPDGRYTNDAGCGNSIADERPMVRKYILDSLEHWLRAYRVDGFRFDLVGTHQPDTVRAICERVKAIRPDATLYGEPWTGGGPIRFGKGAQKGLPFAVFNDHYRNALRGDLDGTASGFVTGPGGDSDAVRRGVLGSIDDFTREPAESINYVSAHDNLALTDKIAKTAVRADGPTRRAMQKLALGAVLVAQGVPFLEGGSEICRTKGGDHNSYVSGDAVNRFDWESKDECSEVHDFVRGMIALRRAHPAFRLDDDAAVRASVRMLDAGALIAWTIDGRAAGTPGREYVVVLNGDPRV
ncbi:MAG: type I pullulanase, partial [Planctomycetota bacterium]